MSKASPACRPIKLDEEIMAVILDNTPKVLIENQIAKLSRVPKSTLHDWLKRGERDNLEGNKTIFGQLSEEVLKIKAEELKKLLFEIRSGSDNYKALIWMVEKCFREDFGAESEEMRELRKLFEQLVLAKGLKNV